LLATGFSAGSNTIMALAKPLLDLARLCPGASFKLVAGALAFPPSSILRIELENAIVQRFRIRCIHLQRDKACSFKPSQKDVTRWILRGIALTFIEPDDVGFAPAIFGHGGHRYGHLLPQEEVISAGNISFWHVLRDAQALTWLVQNPDIIRKFANGCKHLWRRCERRNAAPYVITYWPGRGRTCRHLRAGRKAMNIRWRRARVKGVEISKPSSLNDMSGNFSGPAEQPSKRKRAHQIWRQWSTADPANTL